MLGICGKLKCFCFRLNRFYFKWMEVLFMLIYNRLFNEIENREEGFYVW